MPADQAQYIHRVGRTARAGKQGQALLLLHDFERFFLKHIAELPVTQIEPTPIEVTSRSLPCYVHQACLCVMLVAGDCSAEPSQRRLVRRPPAR